MGEKDSIQAAYAHGFRLIKFRPRSEGELRTRLNQRGYPDEIIVSVLAEFKRKGLIDDVRFARYFATRQMEMQPSGKRVVLQKLKAKGVDVRLASEAVEQATEGKSELERAVDVAQSRWARLQNLPRPVRQRRLLGFLSRRGFSADVVFRVARELEKEE